MSSDLVFLCTKASFPTKSDVTVAELVEILHFETFSNYRAVVFTELFDSNVSEWLQGRAWASCWMSIACEEEQGLRRF